ncbi:hypothetical protein C2845_PM17G02380 [Panicum miliaceum]|uniref:Uncharacterized protein n=1 Tax=Panicum miliaceum TaxID=4540 RepID=A0A3L6Q5N1_PANMI|nr:hypothetical protein C2845_PM17G02380 [Panicum miliaceum]
MDPMFLRFFPLEDGFLVIPVANGTGGHRLRCGRSRGRFFALHDRRLAVHHRRRHRGNRGHRFRGDRGHHPSTSGRRSPPRHQSPDRRSGPSAPAPRQAPAMSAGSTSSERTRTATPPYTHGLVLTGNDPSPAAERLPTPTPPEEPPRRPLVLRLHRPGSNTEGIGVILDLNSTAAAATGDAGFGPRAGPLNAGGRHTVTTFTGATIDVHPSFIFGTGVARRGAPAHPNPGGYSSTAASAASAAPSATPTTTASAAPEAPTPARLFGRVAAIDRRPGVRRGTWNPTTLGFSAN